jgi:uncharacterized protein YukE
MAFEGMDVAQVTNVGNQLRHQGDQIDQIVSAINGLVGQLPGIWHGKDATEFEGWWTQQHRPALQAASAAIHGLGQSALNNASAQQSVSNS